MKRSTVTLTTCTLTRSASAIPTGSTGCVMFGAAMPLPRPCRSCGRPGTPGLCPTCARTADRRRGTPAERGYDAEHRRLRAWWAPQVATGTVRCARCQLLIGSQQAWDLGHKDDRTGWSGPEHAGCNRGRRRPGF